MINRVRPNKSELLQNRKTPSYKGTINHNGTIYKVNADNNHGIYLSVVHKMIDQLEICQEKWGRVFVVRLEMRQRFYTGNNKLMSRFVCNIKKKLLKEYGIREIGFQWVRELGKADAQHYHFVIFLDGYKVQSSWRVHAIARDVWEKIKVGNVMPYVKGKVSYDFRKGDETTKADVIYRVSYLAKENTKGVRDPQAKDYSSSRLP